MCNAQGEAKDEGSIHTEVVEILSTGLLEAELGNVQSAGLVLVDAKGHCSVMWGGAGSALALLGAIELLKHEVLSEARVADDDEWDESRDRD